MKVQYVREERGAVYEGDSDYAGVGPALAGYWQTPPGGLEKTVSQELGAYSSLGNMGYLTTPFRANY